MTSVDDELSAVLQALDRAENAGSPIARPANPTPLAEIAIRRWHSFTRRSRPSKLPERTGRIEDLVDALLAHNGETRSEVGPLIADIRWLSAQMVDALQFIVPSSSEGQFEVEGPKLGVERLHEAASRAGRKTEPVDLVPSAVFDAYDVSLFDGVSALFHHAVPVFTFTNIDPQTTPVHCDYIIDPPFDVGPIISVDWRLLTEYQARAKLNDAYLVDLSATEINRIRDRQAATVFDAMFY